MSLGETSKYVSIIPSNGTEFVAEQKLEFEIKPNISFVKGRDSYLSFDIHNNSQKPAMFFNTVGASALIDRFDIFSLQNGQLLESLTNYNQWASFENQYLHSEKDQLVTKEGCVEPLRAYNSTGFDASTNLQTHIPQRVNQGDTGATRLFTIDSTGNKKGYFYKFCIPLRSGIFNHFGLEEKLTPILLLGGIRVEITLARNEQVLSSLVMTDGTSQRKLDDPVVAENQFLRIANSGGATNILVTSEDQADPQQVGFAVQDRLRILDDNAGTDMERNITAIRINANKLEITVDGGAFNLSTNVRCVHPADVVPTYQIKNVEMKLLEIVPPREMLKTVIKESQFDFISYECFLDNLPATSLNHNVELPSISQKAKAVFTHYINNTTENDIHAPNTYIGNGPTETNLNRVQYFMNNKLYPLKAYNPGRHSDRIVSYNELVKAFSAIGKVVKKLGDANNSNKSDYSYTHLTARELSRGKDFVYDLKNAEAQLRLGFSAGRAFNTKLVSWVFAVRSIMISNNALEVVL